MVQKATTRCSKLVEENRKKEAEANFSKYLEDGLIKKEKSDVAQEMYIKNADLSLNLAEECINSQLNPYLWVVVISYYSMFYIANAVLLELGYKTGDKVAHKVTNDALIVLVRDKIKKGLLEEYETAKEDALEIASVKSNEIISFYVLELDKRSRFQYEMTESIQKQKAETSIKRAKQFMFELKKLLS